MENCKAMKEDMGKMENCKANNIPEKRFLQKLVKIGYMIIMQEKSI